MSVRTLLALAVLALAVGCKKEQQSNGALRVGFFPNITHAQALVGNADGTFNKALPEKGVKMLQFNAGPSAMEALLAGSIDVSYVGPGPAINMFVRTHGELKVIAGAASGGAVLVVKSASSAEDLRGKRVASPQIGNTQDIALRMWLKEHGLSASIGETKKSDVTVVSLSNPDILSLFQRGEIEGAWVPEPWGARLVAEAGAKILVDERTLWPNGQFPTTLIVASSKALKERREDVKAFLKAHLELTARYQKDPDAFVKQVNDAYGALTHHPLSEKILRDAFSRMALTSDPFASALSKDAQDAAALGFIPATAAEGMVDTSLLSELGAAPPKS